MHKVIAIFGCGYRGMGVSCCNISHDHRALQHSVQHLSFFVITEIRSGGCKSKPGRFFGRLLYYRPQIVKDKTDDGYSRCPSPRLHCCGALRCHGHYIWRGDATKRWSAVQPGPGPFTDNVKLKILKCVAPFRTQGSIYFDGISLLVHHETFTPTQPGWSESAPNG